MRAQLPEWVSYLQALTAPAIGLLALVIAWGQWRVAKNRMVLDLFDKRMTAYDELRDILGHVVAAGKATADDTYNFGRAKQRAKFLFDKEVITYLDGLHEHLIELEILESELKGLSEEKERIANVAKQRASKKALVGFYTEFDRLVSSYLHMRAKLRLISIAPPPATPAARRRGAPAPSRPGPAPEPPPSASKASSPA